MKKPVSVKKTVPMKKTLMILGLATLTACGSPDVKPADTVPTADTPSTAPATQAEHDTPNTPALGADGKIHLDIAQFDTGVARADLANYPYPFAVDSVPVQNYAKAYQISAQDAQRAMTLSMASPEALNKVLDMIVGEYLGHSLTDGKDMSLVVYTTDKVAPAEFEYVIADKFGEGLVLPVKVVQASSTKDKPQVDVGAVMDRVHSSDEK